MFYRCDHLKRAIGLLGVALALLSGVQQGHSFCYLAGCASPSAAEGAEADRLVGTCDCSRMCSERQTKSDEESPDAGRSGSCPCPPTCWCHQSPGPLGLPTSAPESAEQLSQSMGQTLAPMTASTNCNRGSTRSLEATIAGSIDGAMLRCAKLCRFLI